MIVLEGLLQKIRHAVNEAATAGDDFSTMVDEALVDFVGLAAPLVVLQAPAVCQVVDSVTYSKNDAACFFTRPDGMTALRITVPEDFCRFISLKAESWVKSVSAIYADTHPSFQNQYSPVPGIGAGPYSPLVYLSSELDEEGMLLMQIIAHAMSKPEACVLSYVKNPEVSDTAVRMDSRLENALAYYTAAFYLQSIDDVTGSQAALNTSKSLIETLANTLLS